MKRFISLKKGYDISKLTDRGIDGLIVNSDGFSSFDGGFDLSELSKSAEVWLRLDCLYEESEIEELGRYLEYAERCGVYGIFFTDIAVNEIIREKGLALKTMYAPETLLTNSFDVGLLLEEMDHVVISQDITLNDIFKIIQANPDRCFLRIHGPILLAYSRRKFISAYLQDDQDKKEGYYVIEETRTNKLPLLQSERGSWLYGSCLQSLGEIKQLEESALAGVIIDDLLYDEEYDHLVMDLYDQVLSGKLDAEKAVDMLEEYDSEIEYTALATIQETWLDKVKK